MLYLTIVSFIWAFSFVLIKGSLTGLDSNFVSFARLALSLLVFLPFLRLQKTGRVLRLQLVVIGGIQFGLMYVAYIASYTYLPAHLVALLTTTTPIFVTLFNDLFSRRFHAVFLVSAVLAVGAGVIIKYPDQSLSASLIGILLIQLSNLAFAFGQIAYARLASKHGGFDDLHVFALLYGGAVLVAGGFSLFRTDFSSVVVNGSQLATLLWLGLVPSGLCFLLWNKGARKVNTGVLAAMNNLKIPLAIVASIFMLAEKTDYVRLVAGCLLMAAALLVNRRVTRVVE